MQRGQTYLSAPAAAASLRSAAALGLRLHTGSDPAALQTAAGSAWVVRWSSLLAVAAQRAFAASLLELPLAGERNVAGDEPELHEVLADVRSQLLCPPADTGRVETPGFAPASRSFFVHRTLSAG